MQVSPTRTRRKFEEDPGVPHVYRMVDVTLDRLPNDVDRAEIALGLLTSGRFEAASVTVRKGRRLVSTIDPERYATTLEGVDRDAVVEVFAVRGRARTEYMIESMRHVRVIVSGGNVPAATSALRQVENAIVMERKEEKDAIDTEAHAR